MTVKVGDAVPSATLMKMTDAGPAPVSTDELFKGRTVALFSVPGAFTPTCSAKHLPGFITHAGEIKAKGIDEIVWHLGQRRVRDGRVGREGRRWRQCHHACRRAMAISSRRSASPWMARASAWDSAASASRC